MIADKRFKNEKDRVNVPTACGIETHKSEGQCLGGNSELQQYLPLAVLKQNTRRLSF